MRSIVLALSLLFSISVFAKIEIQLDSIAPHPAHGSIDIETDNAITIAHNLERLTPKKVYAIFIYAKGDCFNYSELIAPQVLNATGKISNLIESQDYLTRINPGESSSYNVTHGHLSQFIFHQMDFRGKVFVLKELGKGKSVGAAVACGVTP